MKSITILSGKGGVGKSSITASLAVAFSKNKKIICADCDVDASNLSLLFNANKYEEWKNLSTNKKAIFDLNKCISCKKCFDECHFNSIEWKDNKPKLKEFSCEGCGVCEIICPVNAISLKKINNAKIGYANTKYNFKIVSAQLSPGESGSGKVVFEVRKKTWELAKDSDLMLIDAAAGIGCPVIASVTGSDYAIIITEPTPSGFSDMKKAIEIVNHFKIQKGIIINKFDLNKDYTQNIEEFAKMNNIEIIVKIPFDKVFVKAMTKQIPIIEYDKKYQKVFNDIINKIIKKGN
jgi:MinD superfamily P-loop ATPase